MTDDQNEDDAMADMLEQAGVRPEPDRDLAMRVRAVAYRAWQRKLATRRRWRLSLAAAAAVMTIITGLSWRYSVTGVGVELATISVVNGVAQLEADNAANSSPKAGDSIVGGSTLRTLDGFVSVQRKDGVEFRLDRHTELSLVSADALELRRGTVYIDTGKQGAEPGAAVELRSDLGVVSDVGTQFSVHLNKLQMDVSVREGLVIWRSQGKQKSVDAGEQLHVSRQGKTDIKRLPDDAFDWLSSAAHFPNSGVTVRELLTWFAREQQLQLHIAEAVRPDMLKARVYGSPAATSALSRINILLSAAGLRVEARWDSGELWCLLDDSL